MRRRRKSKRRQRRSKKRRSMKNNESKANDGRTPASFRQLNRRSPQASQPELICKQTKGVSPAGGGGGGGEEQRIESQ